MKDISRETLQNIRSTQDVDELGGAKAIAKVLNTDLSRGISPESISENRSLYGANVFPQKPPESFLSHLIDALGDDTLKILFGSAVFTIAFGVWTANTADTIQGLAIVVAAVIVSGVQSFQNWSKGREFASLAQMRKDRQVQVIRGGSGMNISVHDVVVGDLVIINAGDAVPADGVLVKGNDVKINQSAMSGESYDVYKDPWSPSGPLSPSPVSSPSSASGDCILIGSTLVSEGEGLMMATAVGPDSKMGHLMRMIEEDDRKETPLEERLDELAGQIGRFGTYAGGLTFIVLLVLYLYGLYIDGEIPAAFAAVKAAEGSIFQGIWSTFGTNGSHHAMVVGLLGAIARFFIVGVTIVVVAVPEGLPLAVTISLAYSMRRMMKDNNLVRELSACETMGSATVIASDKTGTLTENRMRVVQAWLGGKSLCDINRKISDAASISPGTLRALAKAIALNSNAELRLVDGAHRIEFVGNPSEGALLLMLHMLECSYAEERAAAPAPLARRPFKKEVKYMSTLMPATAGHDDHMLYVKGAPEMILSKCVSEQDESGNAKSISNDRRNALEEEMTAMMKRGLRVLAVAHRRVAKDAAKSFPAGSNQWKDALMSGRLEEGLTLLALVGIQDPLREGVTEAVAKCWKAGIRVIMVTGDHQDTATSIAREAGILKPEWAFYSKQHEKAQDKAPVRVMDGDQFRKLATPAMAELHAEEQEAKLAKDEKREPRPIATVARERLQAVAKTIAVLARSSPEDKRDLVLALQWNDEVVAVTGDGTNDAPALRAAHVGLSMGIAGTEVAKEASKIVILDDKFSSIVASVRWGRSIKENIRKFLTFQLTINMVALTLTFITACANGGSTEKFPITPVQLLWVNLIMDSFAALALATEPPSEHLLDHKPGGKSEQLITKTMWKNMIGHAVFQTALLVWLTMTESGNQFFGLKENGTVAHYTIVFTTFVILQIFNLFNCRAVHDEWNVLADFGASVIGQVIVAVIVIMQVIIVQFGGKLTQTEPMTLSQWGQCVALGFLSVPVGYILKLVPAIDQELRDLGNPSSTSSVLSHHYEPLDAEGTAVRRGLLRISNVAGANNSDAAAVAAVAEAEANSSNNMVSQSSEHASVRSLVASGTTARRRHNAQPVSEAPAPTSNSRRKSFRE